MAAANAALDGMGPSPTMVRRAAGVIEGGFPPEGMAGRDAELLEVVCAGGRGAPLGPRAGWFCWRAMAVIELMRLESDAFDVVSLAVGAFCGVALKARAAFVTAEADGAIGRGRRSPVGGVYAGRPVSAAGPAGARGIVLPGGREVAFSSE